MGVEKNIAQAEAFRVFAKETFTFFEWLTISAAIQWAAIKTATFSLVLLSFFLQLIAVIYVMFTGAIYLRPYVQSVKWKALRWLLALPLVAVLAFSGNWLVGTTVNRLINTQVSDVPSPSHAPARPPH